ncbi:unnamed protein product, partial [Didymodactylos carnosus]
DNATTTTSMNTTSSAPPPSSVIQGLLDQMHDMGLVDDGKNLEALEASNWSLQSAIDILLNDI